MALNKVPHRREQYDPAEHGTIPVHRLRNDRLRGREKTENEEGNKKAKRDDVYAQAPTTK